MTAAQLFRSTLALVLLAECTTGPEMAAPEGGVSFTKDSDDQAEIPRR